MQKCEQGRSCALKNVSLFGNVLMRGRQLWKYSLGTCACVCVHVCVTVEELKSCSVLLVTPGKQTQTVSFSFHWNGRTVGGGIFLADKTFKKTREVADGREDAAKGENGARGGKIFTHTGKNGCIMKQARRDHKIQRSAL